MVVWIRFPELPFEYCEEKWLHRLGNLIGTTLKVDATTLELDRGKYARVVM